MEDDKDFLYDEEEQEHDSESLWREHHGRTIDLGKLDPPASPAKSKSPKQDQETKPKSITLEERGKKYQESKRLQEGQSEKTKAPQDSSEWEQDEEGEPIQPPVDYLIEDTKRKLKKLTHDKDKRRLVRETVEALEKKVKPLLEKEFSDYILERNLPWPRKWITEFKAELRNKRLRSLFDTYWKVLDCRWRHSWKNDWKIDRSRCQGLAKDIKLTERDYIFQDPGFTLREIEKELDLSRPTVIQATKFWEYVGALKKFKHRLHLKEGAVYATGQWQAGKGGFRDVPLLSKKRCEIRIREMFWTWEKQIRKGKKTISETKVRQLEFKKLGLVVEFVKPKK
jgi:hypothetical protein